MDRVRLLMILTTFALAFRAVAVSPEATALAEVLLERKLQQSEFQTPEALWQAVVAKDELLSEWLLQDLNLSLGRDLFNNNDSLNKFLSLNSLSSDIPEVQGLANRLQNTLKSYRNFCIERRAARLAKLKSLYPTLVYARHYIMGGSHYAYTEGLSDAQAERNFHPGSRLCMAEWRKGIWHETPLLESEKGVIRDVDVDYSAKNILFAHKKSDRNDDYHLYQMELSSGDVTQLTQGLGIADYEGCYLPDGSIIFNSTRCMQIVDCWLTEVSNLYRCDNDGSNILRLTFDQVHDNFPTVTWDGRILYTRWEYNDRSQMYPQPLFQMLPDGTAQSAVYGENSWFPTTIIHARAIPGGSKIMAIATGHHSRQTGKLILINPALGRQEAEGVTLVAPKRETKSVIIDAYGQDDELFIYPYPIDEESLIVTFKPEGWHHADGKRHENRTTGFGIYWMDLDGNRELLVSRHGMACGRALPLAERPRPPMRPSLLDYTSKTGTFYIQDIYIGDPMEGVKRGTVKTLRVAAIDYRVAGIGDNGNHGPGGGALVSTPPAIGNGSWDPKIVLGETPVYEDGSAFFTVEARTPLYFMLLDEKGRMVQTMRSWTMVQPGENASCVGCHESKNSVPIATARPTQAMTQGPRPLDPALGPRRGFSFLKEIQPVLDKHCITCHDGSKAELPDLTSRRVTDPRAKRHWTASYIALTHAKPDDKPDGKKPASRWRGNPDHKLLNWVSAASVPTLLPPYSAGSNKSELFSKMLDKNHCETISKQEIDLLALWVDLGVPFCGDYTEAADWNEKDWDKHNYALRKRQQANAEDQETIRHLSSRR